MLIELKDFFWPGHNGPYHDPETPVRNTAHWLFLLASLYAVTGESRWKMAGENAVRYLMSNKARPYGKTFHCRDNAGKDHCNGLVGQAWVIEALVKAAEAFDREDCYDLAEEVFLLHPWNGDLGIWQRVEIDGTILTYDGTFNHQLWFAATGGLLTRTPEAQKRTTFFLENIAARVQLYPNGVIFHSSAMGNLVGYLKNGILPLIKEIKSRVRKRTLRNNLYSKSVGYHGFNLYAFAMLKNVFPAADIWDSEIFKNLLITHRLNEFQRDVKNSEVGYHYNLSGIEIAYAVETFFQDRQEASAWLNRQFEETYLDESHPLSRGVADPSTADARIYQAARLENEYFIILE